MLQEARILSDQSSSSQKLKRCASRFDFAFLSPKKSKIKTQTQKMHFTKRRVELISADPFEFTDIVNSSRRKVLRPRRIFATALKSSNSRRRVRLIVVVVETQF